MEEVLEPQDGFVEGLTFGSPVKTVRQRCGVKLRTFVSLELEWDIASVFG
jgi:hypothetical protein